MAAQETDPSAASCCITVTNGHGCLDKTDISILATLSTHEWLTASAIARAAGHSQGTVYTHLSHIDEVIDQRQTTQEDNQAVTEYRRLSDRIVLEFDD